MGRKRRVLRRSLVPVSVKNRFSYIDTICAVLPEKMPKSMFRLLRVSLCAALRPFGRRYVLKRVPTVDGFWIFKLTIHQPTPASIQIVEEAIESLRARFLEVHVSLDLITDSYADSLVLQDYLEHRLIPSTRQKKPIKRIGNTVYFNRMTRKGFEVAIYSDKPSKVTKEPCCHLDWRWIGSDYLKKADLTTGSEILGMDHKLFWNKSIALWLPPSLTVLSRVRNGKTGSRQLDAVGSTRNQSQARLLLRSAANLRGVVVAHELLRTLRKHESTFSRKAIQLFSQEPHDWMLPPRGNALWT